jgi:hypothetical protein
MESDKDFEQKLREVRFKTSSQHIGKRGYELASHRKHGKNGKFTDHLIQSGMWRNNGLHTRVDTEKYVDECSSKTFSSL